MDTAEPPAGDKLGKVAANGPKRIPGWRIAIAIFCLLFSLALSMMDSIAVSTALITIGDHFNNTAHINWVVLSYMLTDIGFAVVFSRLSDIIGRKWASILAVAILTIGSIACGCASSLNQLIAFRAIQGLGGSGCYSLAFLTIPEITPPPKLQLVSALIGMCISVGSITGTVVGGVLVTHSTWRWVFWFNIPCCGLILALMVLFCPNFSSPGTISWKKFDWLGCAVYMAVSVLPALALQQAGSGSWKWDSAAFIVCFVLAGLGIIFLCFWLPYLTNAERHFEPLFPSRILSHRGMLFNFVVTILVGFVMLSNLITLPQRFQLVNHKSPEMAGIFLIPLSGATAIGSIIGATGSSRNDYTWFTINFGTALTLAGMGGLYTLDDGAYLQHKMFGFEVLYGLGLGMAMSSSTVLVKLHACIEDAAPAQGLTSQARLIGGELGIAIANVVSNQHLMHDLKGQVPEKTINALRRSLTASKYLNAQQLDALRISYAKSYRTDVTLFLCVLGVTFIAGLFIWQGDPRKLPGISALGEEREQQKDNANQATGSSTTLPV